MGEAFGHDWRLEVRRSNPYLKNAGFGSAFFRLQESDTGQVF